MANNVIHEELYWATAVHISHEELEYVDLKFFLFVFVCIDSYIVLLLFSLSKGEILFFLIEDSSSKILVFKYMS